MISILKHLSVKQSNVEDFLEKTVQQLWSDLNPINKVPGTYAKRSLLYKANNLISTLSEQKYTDKVGVIAAQRHLLYARHLASPENLKQIITAKPKDLPRIISNANHFLEKDDLCIESKGKIESSPLGKLLLKKLFNYETYRSSAHCYKIYKQLDFDQATCPYCNDNSVKIVKINKNSSKRSLMMLYDIDHFYPRHTHPYLALSFYNHIPSCKICNQTYKGSKSFAIGTHIHPYQECFDSIYKFEFNHSILANQPIESIKLRNNSSFPDELAGTLQLESRYQSGTLLARTPKLIEILSKRTHLLRNSTLSPQEHEALNDLLSCFGLVHRKEEILYNHHSKLHRDITKFFDVYNTLKLN